MSEIREKALQTLKKKYPDKEFAEDEDLTSYLVDHIGELEDYQTKNSEANGKLIEIFEAEPELVAIIKDLVAGATLREALARHVDPQDLQPVEGDPDYEGWTKNRNERVSKLEGNKKLAEEQQKNIDLSIAQAEEFAQEKAMTPEETNAFLDKVDETLAPILNGKVDKNFLEQMWKALNYETDLTSARQLGEASMLNKKVIAEKENVVGDGLPNISGSGDEVKASPPKKKGYIERLKNENY